jgi:hypothetical protein
MMQVNAYKVINDSREAILIKHNKICYPPANLDLIQNVDTSFPGIVIDFGNGKYLLEDGCHRIAKLQKEGIFESLFYVVTVEEYRLGVVDMIYGSTRITLGEWNHNALDLICH